MQDPARVFERSKCSHDTPFARPVMWTANAPPAHDDRLAQGGRVGRWRIPDIDLECQFAPDACRRRTFGVARAPDDVSVGAHFLGQPRCYRGRRTFADIGSFRARRLHSWTSASRSINRVEERAITSGSTWERSGFPTCRPDAHLRSDLPASHDGGRRVGVPLPGNRHRRADTGGGHAQTRRDVLRSQAALAESRHSNVRAYRHVYGRHPRGWPPA